MARAAGELRRWALAGLGLAGLVFVGSREVLQESARSEPFRVEVFDHDAHIVHPFDRHVISVVSNARVPQLPLAYRPSSARRVPTRHP